MTSFRRLSFFLVLTLTSWIGLPLISQAQVKDTTQFHFNNPVNSSKGQINEQSSILLSGSTIAENSPDGSVVGVLRVINANTGISSSSDYRFVLADDANQSFSLSDSLLIVRNSKNIDYEKHKYFEITVKAIGENGTSINKTFRISVINVNEPPVNIALSNTKVPENSTGGTVVGSVSGVDPDSADVLTFQIVSNPENYFKIVQKQLVVGDSAHIDYEKTPDLPVTIRATDRDGLYLDKIFTIRVLNRNDAPTDIALSNSSIDENSPIGTIIGNLSTADEDSGDTHMYKLIDNANGRFNLNGKELVVADSAHLDYEADSTHTIVVQTTDKGGLSFTKSLVIHVINVNEPPVIKGFRDVVTDEDVPSDTLHFYISDPETPSGDLHVSAYSSNPDLIDQNGINLGGTNHDRWMVLAARHDSSGTAYITYTVSDGVNNSSGTIKLTVEPVNDPPVLALNKGLTLDEGSGKIIQIDDLNVTDVDNKPSELSFTISKNPEHGAIYRDTTRLNPNDVFTEADLQKGIISYKHDGSETIRDSLFFKVEDGAGGEINHIPFKITIIPVNDPPVISRIPSLRTLEDTPTKPVTFRISDAETPAAYLELSASSSNNTLLPDSDIVIRGLDKERIITLTPAPNQNGTALVTIIVSDGQAHDISRFFFIVDPVNDPPTVTPIADHETNEDHEAKIKFRISDIDTPIDQLEVWAKSSDDELIPTKDISFKGHGNKREMIIKPGRDYSGSANITLFVSDQDSTISTNFNLKVAPVNDPPDLFALYNSDIYVAADSLAITFHWEQAVDKEKDPVSYILNIKGDQLDTTISNIYQTEYTFNGKNILKENDLYDWSVSATDGKDTTTCMMSKDFISPKVPGAPNRFALSPNYPNPFNPVTTIHYQVPMSSNVTISVYDLLGRKVIDLVNSHKMPGDYQVDWNAAGQASGVYIYQIIAISDNGQKKFAETRKMLLVK